VLRAQAQRHSSSQQDGDDALQDACLLFLAKFDGSAIDLSHALRWMQVVVKRCAWRIGRKARAETSRRSRAEHDPDGGDVVQTRVASSGRGPAEQVELKAELERKTGHFARLKRDERIALALVALGYSYVEIRARFGWTHAKVNRCVAEGRAALREMEGEENE